MKLFKTLFFALVCIALISCSSDKKSGVTEVKVAFWGSPEEIQIITNSIAEWQTAHPDIKVVFEHTPYSGYDSKILTRIAGGAAPDIIATEASYFVTFSTKGILEDLNPFVARDPAFKKEDFFEPIVNRFTYENKLMALPRDVAPYACVFYNKKIFDEAGMPYPTNEWTTDDLLRVSRDLTKKDTSGKIIRYGFYTWAWENFIYSFGGALVDNVEQPTKTLIASPEAIAGMQFYADMANVFNVMPTPTTYANFGMGVDQLFAKGQIAMFGSGIWETPSLRKYEDLNWDVVMFPHAKGKPAAVGTGGTGYAILKTSKNKAAAWEVLKAFTGPEVQSYFAAQGLAQPSRKAVAAGASWAEDLSSKPANKKMLNEAVYHSVYTPFHPDWREIEDKLIAPAREVILSGRKSAKEVFVGLESEINASLKSGKGV